MYFWRILGRGAKQRIPRALPPRARMTSFDEYPNRTTGEFRLYFHSRGASD
jgi:hypothetical protein